MSSLIKFIKRVRYTFQLSENLARQQKYTSDNKMHVTAAPARRQLMVIFESLRPQVDCGIQCCKKQKLDSLITARWARPLTSPELGRARVIDSILHGFESEKSFNLVTGPVGSTGNYYCPLYYQVPLVLRPGTKTIARLTTRSVGSNTGPWCYWQYS